MPRICPKCREPGYGPYAKVVKGYKYQYMQHWSSEKRGKRWCYLGSDTSCIGGRLKGIVKAKSAARRMVATLRVTNRPTPEDILHHRTPGELDALIYVAKASFDRIFKMVRPREYRFRDAR